MRPFRDFGVDEKVSFESLIKLVENNAGVAGFEHFTTKWFCRPEMLLDISITRVSN